MNNLAIALKDAGVKLPPVTATNWKKVEKAEFDAFIAGYPLKLEKDVTGICDPPMRSYNDFSDGKIWPESMVAKVTLNTMMKGLDYHGEPDDYYLRA